MATYRIYYEHHDCPEDPDVKWDDTWSCACNGECPACETKDIEPVDWELIGPLKTEASSVYEVEMPGFDASTDATDHLIKWVRASSVERVRRRFSDAQNVTDIGDDLDSDDEEALDETLADDDGPPWTRDLTLTYDGKGGCVVSVGHCDEVILTARIKTDDVPASAIFDRLCAHVRAATAGLDDLCARLRADESLTIEDPTHQ
jgi:hypothetical protein